MVAGGLGSGHSRDRTTQQTRLHGSHRGFLVGFGVIHAHDVQRPVGDEESQLVGGRPTDVTRLAATSGLGLLSGTLDGHDDVAEVGTLTGRQDERVVGQQGEGQDVRRALVAHVREVQRRQLGVIGEDQADRSRRRSMDGIERRRDGPGQRRQRDG